MLFRSVRVPIESDQEVDPSQPAVKNVLTNTGKEKERWKFKDEKELEAGKDLKTFMGWLAGRDDADDGSEAT